MRSINLVSNGSGNASIDPLNLSGGTRYAFGWRKGSSAPAAGTLLVTTTWAGLPAPACQFQDGEGNEISFDLATVQQGGFEFVMPFDGELQVNLSGAGSAKNVALVISQINE